MSDLHNPLFNDEKEFLEQKKLEYERALRGDVEQIKEKTVQVGKFALTGAGVAGTVWLITRLLGRKKNRPRRFDNESDPDAGVAEGKKVKKSPKDLNGPKSAAASAAVFQEALEFDSDTNETAPQPGPATHEPDPFEPQPVAPPRPAALGHDLGLKEVPKAESTSKVTSQKKAPQKKDPAPRRPLLSPGAVETLGTLAKAAWQSESVRRLLSQALAAGLAALAGRQAVKTAVEDAQAPKNPDLAASADAAAAGAGAAGPLTSAQPSSTDAPRQQLT